MKFKLFNKSKKIELGDADLPRVCRFCERATLINDEENVLCSDKGIVLADFCCRKFSYDPLKREPKMPPPMPKPDPTIIELELPLFLMPDAPAPAAEETSENLSATDTGMDPTKPDDSQTHTETAEEKPEQSQPQEEPAAQEPA